MARQTISVVDKQRLVSAFENGQDYTLLAGQLGVKDNTAYKIIQRTLQRDGIVNLPRGGKKAEKVDEEMRAFVEDQIERDPCITLKALNAKLRLQLPNKPQVCDRTISNICDGLLFTVKDVQLQPANRNAPHVKEERIEYANWFLQHAVLQPHIVFVDESGFNAWTCRSKGRSRRGTPATKVVSNQRGNNVTLMLAISPQRGVLHHHFTQNSTSKALFEQFIADLGEKMPVVGGQSIVVMDNAPIHHGIQPPRADILMKFLPPYSSPLNPIEEAFSVWKSALKARLSTPENQAILANPGPGYSLHQWRLLHLQQLGALCLPAITVEKCHHLYNHSLAFLHKCLHNEDI